MKWKTFIVPTLLLVLSSSCKKDNSNSSASNSNRLKLYIEDATNTSYDAIDSFSFTYDGQNRITSLYSTNIKTVYAYPTSNTFTLDLYTYGVFNIHEIAYINGSSLVDSTFQYDNTNDTTTEGYIYSSRLLMRKSTYDYSAVTGAQISTQDDYTYDNNGNPIKDIQSDGYGNVNTVSTFTYTNQLLNYSIGPTYIPQSKNLPATQVQTDGLGNHIATVAYTYVFDSSNRVIKETDAVDNGESVVKTYVYY
jgi:hypothetical protein